MDLALLCIWEELYIMCACVCVCDLNVGVAKALFSSDLFLFLHKSMNRPNVGTFAYIFKIKQIFINPGKPLIAALLLSILNSCWACSSKKYQTIISGTLVDVLWVADSKKNIENMKDDETCAQI